MNKQFNHIYFWLTGCLIFLFAGSLAYGSVTIPLDAVADILLGNEIGRESWKQIVLHARLPQSVTAVLAGSSLAVSGLLLQTLFKNPLAGPSIL